MLLIKRPDSTCCLDMLPISWIEDPATPRRDEAILLEVSGTGGVLHAGLNMPVGTDFQIETESANFSARVRSCEDDGCGFVVRFTVASQRWFPAGFQPAILKTERALDRDAGRNRPGKSSHAA